MAMITCRVQYLEDTDPFVCTNFPEPRRPPHYDFSEVVPLNLQIAGVQKQLQAPLKVNTALSLTGEVRLRIDFKVFWEKIHPHIS